MGPWPTGTVTFLFTDIEGSTKLAQEHPRTWETLRARHHEILRAAMEAHHGHIFQIVGDAFCVAFHTASDAINAGVEAQRALAGLARGTPAELDEGKGEKHSALMFQSASFAIKVRAGIHTGKAEVQEDGGYHGYLTLSRVQRLMSAGHGGQTLISRAVQELVRDELPRGVRLRDMGAHRLKDLIHPEHIYQVDAPDLPTTFPALKTLEAQLNNLPSQLTPFVGREREIAALLGLLRNPGVHLVTLTGAGGTGKTRLALQVAAELLDEFEHGVWFCELAAIRDPALVLTTLATTLKVKDSAETTLEQALQNHLHGKRLLLVVDNFEQVIPAAPKLAALLQAAPKIKILVSSREVLRLRGEHDYPVPPLGLPETKRPQTAAVLAQSEAVALFLQHAQAANPAFVLDDDNASIVATICSQLDGLPLALELAAARARLLKPALMLEKLKNKLDVLTGGARDLPHRQQTIRGAIGWSYDLLEEAEQVLFARLGIFVGGWTLDSAEAVCGGAGGVNVLNGIEALLDKSLIRPSEVRSGESRFSMLETIREYAFEELSRRAEFESIRQKYVDANAALLEKAIVSTGSAEEVLWFARLDAELDNLRSAMEWTLGHQQPRLAVLAGRLSLYWTERLNFREPLEWVERVLAMPVELAPLERAHALNSAGNLYFNLLDMPRAKKCYESALPFFVTANDKVGLSRILNNLGNLEFNEKNFEKARHLYETSLTYEEADSWGVVMTSINLGGLAIARQDWDQARYYYQHTREVSERLGSETGVSSATLWLATLDLVLRRLEESRSGYARGFNATWLRVNPLYAGLGDGYLAYVDLLIGTASGVKHRLRRALEVAAEFMKQSPNLPSPWLLIEGQARLDVMHGYMQHAAQLFGASWTQRDVDTWPLTEFERPDYEAAVNRVRTALGEERFTQLFEQGKAMSLSEAITVALEDNSV